MKNLTRAQYIVQFLQWQKLIPTIPDDRAQQLDASNDFALMESMKNGDLTDLIRKMVEKRELLDKRHLWKILCCRKQYPVFSTYLHISTNRSAKPLYPVVKGVRCNVSLACTRDLGSLVSFETLLTLSWTVRRIHYLGRLLLLHLLIHH